MATFPIHLNKLLFILVCPLGLTLLLGLTGMILLFARRYHKAGLCLITTALIWLYLSSMPIVADTLLYSLESRYPELTVNELPDAEAIVVLGGGVDPSPTGKPYPDLKSGADRVWHAARIFHAGKGPLIVLSGGVIPWRVDASSEASAMQRFIADLGVPLTAIRLEERSVDTRGNALFTAKLLAETGTGRVLLVSSALHMPRAMAAFKAVGIEPTAAATDFTPKKSFGLMAYLPDTEALENSTSAIHEYIGLLAYRVRGWS